MMNLVIAYDIADPRRLVKIAKVMEDYGHRVQLSIFEARVTAPAFEQMAARAKKIMDPDEDGVKFFHLCEKCMGTIEVIGNGIYVDPDQEYEVL